MNRKLRIGKPEGAYASGNAPEEEEPHRQAAGDIERPQV